MDKLLKEEILPFPYEKNHNKLNRHIFEKVTEQASVKHCLKKIRAFSIELYEHSIKVANLALFIAHNEKNINIEKLYTAALLHDYGKMYINKSILYKADTLTFEERKEMNLHAGIGYLYLKELTDIPNDVLKGVLEHHEKINGTGYYKLKSKEICMYAKVIAIADVYDAMISDRVYRKGIDQKEVIEYINANSGILFHKRFSQKFVRQCRANSL